MTYYDTCKICHYTMYEEQVCLNTETHCQVCCDCEVHSYSYV